MDHWNRMSTDSLADSNNLSSRADGRPDVCGDDLDTGQEQLSPPVAAAVWFAFSALGWTVYAQLAYCHHAMAMVSHLRPDLF